MVCALKMDTKISYRNQNQYASSSTDHRLASVGSADVPSQNAAQLRRVLSVMFPQSYIRLYHQPPHSVCSLFSIKQVAPLETTTTSELRRRRKKKEDESVERVFTRSRGQATNYEQDGQPPWSTFVNVILEPSTEPSSRVQVLHLQNQLAESLVGHKAKPVGLCPIRRAIYDQCFDEIIRQVTVGCIERGLLLFRIRNELRMTMSCYRRLYESAICYGLNKSIDASLQQFREEQNSKVVDGRARKSGHDDQAKMVRADLHPDDELQGDTVSRLKEYYENELAKRDEIIGQQRALMRSLNLNLEEQQRSGMTSTYK